MSTYCVSSLRSIKTKEGKKIVDVVEGKPVSFPVSGKTSSGKDWGHSLVTVITDILLTKKFWVFTKNDFVHLRPMVSLLFDRGPRRSGWIWEEWFYFSYRKWFHLIQLSLVMENYYLYYPYISEEVDYKELEGDTVVLLIIYQGVQEGHRTPV